MYFVVLIVAKCIVNFGIEVIKVSIVNVLIVAKCIVNKKNEHPTAEEKRGINSSKVYCKCFWNYKRKRNSWKC